MLNLSLNELKLLTKKRGIIGYKSMCKERSLSALSESESVESKSLKKIREDFNELRDRFSKPQIKEIRKNLYYTNKPKKSFKTKNKRNWRSF